MVTTTMTMTDKIAEELLAAADDPTAVDAIFQQYGQSKGPYYKALGRATSALQERCTSLSHQAKEAQQDCLERQQQVQALEQKHASLEKSLTEKGEEFSSVEAELKAKAELMDQTRVLGGLGFGLQELSQLRDRLAKLAASQGMKSAETIKLFFELVAQYEDILSLGNEAERAQIAAGKAKADAERWQAEASAAEAKAKARKVSIDLTEKLLAQGVKEADLPQWTAILGMVAVAPEKLADELEQFASMEKVCQDRQEQAKKLEMQVKELSSQVTALRAERQKVSAAITAVRDEALTQVAHTAEKVQANLNTLVAKAGEYAKLLEQAEKLKRELALTRAFNADDPARWKGVDRVVVREFLARLLIWCRVDPGHNVVLMPPPQGPFASGSYSYSLQKPTLSDALRWAGLSLFTDEERKALTDTAKEGQRS